MADDTTPENEMRKRAIAYCREHRTHVMRLIDGARRRNATQIEPSGSDRLHPELWKDIHWAWYFGQDWSGGQQ